MLTVEELGAATRKTASVLPFFLSLADCIHCLGLEDKLYTYVDPNGLKEGSKGSMLPKISLFDASHGSTRVTPSSLRRQSPGARRISSFAPRTDLFCFLPEHGS